MRFIYYSSLFILLCFCSCKDSGPKESTPTMGDIRIACDVQLKEIMVQEEDIFERNYKYAKLDLVYKNESTILKMLREDSIHTAVLCRSLSKEEWNDFISNNKVHPRVYPFAKGALALLCNKDAADTGMLYEDFLNLCQGNPLQKSSFNTVVIEDVGSGIAQFLLQKMNAAPFSKSVYTLENKEAIFNYLKQNKQAIAVLDWSEFSDSDNSTVQARLNSYKVLGISRPKDSLQLGYLHPDQYLLQDDKYPLTRTYYFISTSGKSDLGLGFASFVTGEIGQRILLKAGLLPLYQTERWIELKGSSFKVVK
jgi:phosphate transport system substrate-binding protein